MLTWNTESREHTLFSLLDIHHLVSINLVLVITNDKNY